MAERAAPLRTGIIVDLNAEASRLAPNDLARAQALLNGQPPAPEAWPVIGEGFRVLVFMTVSPDWSMKSGWVSIG